jgi:uncharacterized protein YndB with AHSA1/START domain
VIEPLEITFTVACTPEHAFEMWTTRASSWWPTGHTFSGEPGVTVTFEPRAGGRIHETAPDGTEREWGEIIDFEAPRRIRYLWHLMFDRGDATEVTVTFAPLAEGTEVRIVHAGWERLGAETGRERRDRTRAGWEAVIGHYAPACAGAPTG